MIRKLSYLVSLFLFPLLLSAQPYPYEGCVIDEDGDPLAYVQISIDKLGPVGFTDIEGCYSFSHDLPLAKLVFVYAGHQEKTISGQTEVKPTVTLLKATKKVSPTTTIVLPGEMGKTEEAFMRGERPSRSSKDAPVSYREESREPTRLERGEVFGFTDASVSSAPAMMSDMAPVSSPPPPPPPPPPPASAFESYSADYAAAPSGTMATPKERPAAGQLTAGEVNDFGKWELWNDVSQEDLAAYRDVWALYPDHRYAVQLTLPNGQPLINHTVELYEKNGAIIWTAKTDNHGRAELWQNIFDPAKSRQARLGLRTLVDGKAYELPTAHTISEGMNSFTLPLNCQETTAVDIAFVVDATGSMGDEIRYLSSELQDVMRRAADSLQGQDLRLASVFYRDHSDTYLTRTIDFAAGQEKVIDFVGQQSANGGGDTPEAVDDALAMALNKLKWRKEAATRLLFLVLDAPPHQTAEHVKRMQGIAEKAARMGVRIVPVVCSGMDQKGEYLLRSLALATNGTYTFLTDHSGIGNSHLEPSTDAYEVEKLNDLLVRIIHQFGKVTTCNTVAATPLPTRIQIDQQVDWSVFPNPTGGETTLSFAKAVGEVYLLDANGKLLRRYAVTQQQQRINLGDLPSGSYYLRHEYEGVSSTQQIMVNRA